MRQKHADKDLPLNAMQAQAAAPGGETEIAIIGMACLFPQAADLTSFWRNILGKVYAVGEPTESWGAERYYVPGSTSDEHI